MNQNEHKRRAIEDAMGTGIVAIVIDATRSLGLPLEHRKSDPLKLELGYNLPFPTNDLTVDDDAIRVTLTFARVAHFVVIPWDALHALRCEAFFTQWPMAEGRELQPTPEAKPAHGLRLVKGSPRG